MIDEIDFVAEHKKADVSKVNRIRVNGKTYLSEDKVLEIVEQMKSENNENNGDPIRTLFEIEYNDFRDRVLELKGGEQE